jgi:VRR-NUC domain
VVWIEVKTATGRLSEHQEQFRDDIAKQGGKYIVVRSLDDVIREGM